VRRPAALLVILVLAGCVHAPTPTPLAPHPASTILERALTPLSANASEVSIAASPKDPNVAIAASNGGAAIWIYRTQDGGRTWTNASFGPDRLGPITGRGRFLGLGDPSVAFGGDGAVYLAGLAVLPNSAVFVARSLDGGQTWPQVKIIWESEVAATFNDKEWIGVDPRTGTLLVAWQFEPLMDSLRSVDQLTGLDVDVGHIVVSRSTDHGQQWTVPERISVGLHNNGTQIAYTPGKTHAFWVNYETPGLEMRTSTDDAKTWGPIQKIAPIVVSGSLPRYNRIHTLPAFVSDPHHDTLVAAWHDPRGGDLDVYAAASRDAGATWGPAVRVNHDAEHNGAIQFFPWAAIGSDGRIHVAYYDARDDPHKPLFRYWLSTANDTALRFDEGRPISTKPFTAFTGSGPDGNEARGLGDYTGLATNAGGLWAAWADGRGKGTHVYGAHIG
jgi:hypothetical protein